MTTDLPHSTIGGARRRLLPCLILAAAATVALPAWYVAQPLAAETSVASGSVRLTDMALSPQPDRTGGFAADGDDNQAQLQQQLNQQQLQQSMQQAQEQNDEAEQQFNRDMQQQQTYENQFNNP
ncbi:MAG: hypothetical protein VX424_21310 [Actinomycetota bacterium]|nr:hypothetical protein [Actinomycetota bacterium]